MAKRKRATQYRPQPRGLPNDIGFNDIPTNEPPLNPSSALYGLINRVQQSPLANKAVNRFNELEAQQTPGQYDFPLKPAHFGMKSPDEYLMNAITGIQQSPIANSIVDYVNLPTADKISKAKRFLSLPNQAPDPMGRRAPSVYSTSLYGDRGATPTRARAVVGARAEKK